MKEYLQSVSFKEIKATQQPREDDASVAQGLGEVKALAHSQGQGEEAGARGEGPPNRSYGCGECSHCPNMPCG